MDFIKCDFIVSSSDHERFNSQKTTSPKLHVHHGTGNRHLSSECVCAEVIIKKGYTV